MRPPEGAPARPGGAGRRRDRPNRHVDHMRQADPFQRVVGRKPAPHPSNGGGKGESSRARSKAVFNPSRWAIQCSRFRQRRLRPAPLSADLPRCGAQADRREWPVSQRVDLPAPLRHGHEQCVPLPEIEAEPAKRSAAPRPPDRRDRVPTGAGDRGRAPPPAIRCGSVCRITKLTLYPARRKLHCRCAHGSRRAWIAARNPRSIPIDRA